MAVSIGLASYASDDAVLEEMSFAATLARATAGAGPFAGIDDPSLDHLVATSSIDAAGDERYLTLALAAGQTVNLDVDFAAGDLRLLVLDATGALVAQNNTAPALDAGSTSRRDPFLAFTPSEAGFYHIVVTSADNLYLGDFAFENDGTGLGAFQLDVGVAGLPPRTLLGTGNDTLNILPGDPQAGQKVRILARGGSDFLILIGTDAATVDGGLGNDSVLFGGSGDAFDGGPGSDFADGGAGDDALFGGAGNDQLNGGDGDDELIGGRGNDLLHDAIDGATGFSRLFGGLGDDTLVFGPDGGVGFGGAGFDNLQAGAGKDRLVGGLGNDTLTDFQGGNDTILGGPGHDFIFGGPGHDLLIGGGPGSDTIFGGEGADTLEGGEGNELLAGNEGNDVLRGGPGNDTLMGGPGADSLDGGDGNDWVSFENSVVAVSVELNVFTAVGEGADTITGVENIIGSPFNDFLRGKASNNIIRGLAGDDSIQGRGGNDRLFGDEEDDLLNGGEGHDRLEGGAGKDHFFGNEGRDTIDGGFDDDVMVGGAGADLLTGDLGADRFFYVEVLDSTLLNSDTITDFTQGFDVVALNFDADITYTGFQSFKFVGKTPTGQSGELWHEISVVPAVTTTLYGNIDNDPEPEFQIIFHGGIDFQLSDFFGVS